MIIIVCCNTDSQKGVMAVAIREDEGKLLPLRHGAPGHAIDMGPCVLQLSDLMLAMVLDPYVGRRVRVVFQDHLSGMVDANDNTILKIELLPDK